MINPKNEDARLPSGPRRAFSSFASPCVIRFRASMACQTTPQHTSGHTRALLWDHDHRSDDIEQTRHLSMTVLDTTQLVRHATASFPRVLFMAMNLESATAPSSAMLQHGRQRARAASASDAIGPSPKPSLADRGCARHASTHTPRCAATHAPDALRTGDTRGDPQVKIAWDLC